MPTYSKACCDANVVVRLHDPASSEYTATLTLWEKWIGDRVQIVAPTLLRYEVANVVHRSALTGTRLRLSTDTILRSLESLPIEYVDDVQLHIDAVRIAQELRLPAADDAHYLALAQREDIDLYTLDRRLVNATRGKLSFVRYVMDE